MISARLFRNSPFISLKFLLDDDVSWVDKGILMNTYYCVNEDDMVNVSWHFRTSKFNCPMNIDYKKVSTLSSDKVDVSILVMFNGILYGKSYSIIDYVGESESIGVIDKLIDNEYIPKLNRETNTKDILNAFVFDETDSSIILLYNNQYVLFEKINN